MSSALDKKLAAIESMQAPELRTEWERAYKKPAPKLSAELLRLGLAWRVQEQQLGGLGRHARSVLTASNDRDAATIQKRKHLPGTRLLRDWHGVGHTVTVLEDGFDYDGKRWSSLTAVARHITGAKWSGPRFFGLTGTGS